jgi:hypothetical protein
MVFSRYLLMLAPLACAACAPIPHAATTRPAISGSLTSAGAPVVGREIWAAHGTDADPCARPSVQAATNQDGKFTLPRQTELRLIYAPWFTSSELITLCVATTDKPLLILRVGFLPTTPPAIELACDLETPASRRTAWGLCRIDTTTGS